MDTNDNTDVASPEGVNLSFHNKLPCINDNVTADNTNTSNSSASNKLLRNIFANITHLYNFLRTVDVWDAGDVILLL